MWYRGTWEPEAGAPKVHGLLGLHKKTGERQEHERTKRCCALGSGAKLLTFGSRLPLLFDHNDGIVLILGIYLPYSGCEGQMS